MSVLFNTTQLPTTEQYIESSLTLSGVVSAVVLQMSTVYINGVVSEVVLQISSACFSSGYYK
jgi:hypothetical protein